MDGWTPEEATWQDIVPPEENSWWDVPVESVFIEGELLRVYDYKSERDKAFLTPQERQILKFYTSKLTPKQIAKKLKITVDTVYVHIYNLKEKAFRLDTLAREV